MSVYFLTRLISLNIYIFRRISATKVRAKDVEVKVYLYDGYDWAITRKTIEEGIKAVRRKLLKIRQLLASGQAPDDSVEDTYTTLFNSVHIGLPSNADEMEQGELIAAIDAQLADDIETASQSSWQSFNRPQPKHTRNLSGISATKPRSSHGQGRRLTRSRQSSIEISLADLYAEFDQFHPHEDDLSSRVLVTVRDMEILDHIQTSTWKKFLTELTRDTRGNIRETDSNMVRVELTLVRPVPGNPSEEARLKVSKTCFALGLCDAERLGWAGQDPSAETSCRSRCT